MVVVGHKVNSLWESLGPVEETSPYIPLHKLHEHLLRKETSPRHWKVHGSRCRILLGILLSKAFQCIKVSKQHTGETSTLGISTLV